MSLLHFWHCTFFQWEGCTSQADVALLIFILCELPYENSMSITYIKKRITDFKLTFFNINLSVHAMFQSYLKRHNSGLPFVYIAKEESCVHVHDASIAQHSWYISTLSPEILSWTMLHPWPTYSMYNVSFRQTVHPGVHEPTTGKIRGTEAEPICFLLG